MKISIDQLPKRIVISRKGSDSAWGGSPSLIVDNELISLPIPQHPEDERKKICGKHLKYSQLPRHKVIGDYVSYLPKLKLQGQECVHLDPDIRIDLRVKGSKSHKLLFGQSDAAEGHLRNHQIGESDLFLFFGWFREYRKGHDKYTPHGPDQHVMWGWFQIEEKHQLEGLRRGCALQKEFSHHPHVARIGEPNGPRRDSLYVASSTLSFANQLPGAGIFPYSSSQVLTRLCERKSNRTEWCIPSFFVETGLTYNAKSINKSEFCTKDQTRIHMNSASIGQEFVFPSEKNKTLQDFPKRVQLQVAAWLEAIFVSLNL